MPNIQAQFSGGVLVYLDAVDMADDLDIPHNQDAIDQSYSAACQALNKLNVIRAAWQKQNRKEAK